MSHLVPSDLVAGQSYSISISSEGVYSPCVYMGYDAESNHYKFFDPVVGNIYFFTYHTLRRYVHAVTPMLSVYSHIYQMNRDNNP